MTLRLKRNPDRIGCSDEWTATTELRPGIGKGRTEAVGNLISANPEAFGVTTQVDEDPKSTHPVVTWLAPRYEMQANTAGQLPDIEDRLELERLAAALVDGMQPDTELRSVVRAMIEILTGPREMTARPTEDTLADWEASDRAQYEKLKARFEPAPASTEAPANG